MNRFLLIFLLLGLSACGTVRPVSTADSTKVEVRYETVVEHDTAFVQLPVVVEKVAVLDTVSHLENKYAASSAVVSGGELRHSLETKPVVLSAPVEKVTVYRDSLVYVDKVQTVTVEVPRALTGWQQAKLRVGGFCFFLVILLGLYIIITRLLNLKLF